MVQVERGPRRHMTGKKKVYIWKLNEIVLARWHKAVTGTVSSKMGERRMDKQASCKRNHEMGLLSIIEEFEGVILSLNRPPEMRVSVSISFAFYMQDRMEHDILLALSG